MVSSKRELELDADYEARRAAGIIEADATDAALMLAEIGNELASVLDTYTPSGGNELAGTHIIDDSISFEDGFITADLASGDQLILKVTVN